MAGLGVYIQQWQKIERTKKFINRIENSYLRKIVVPNADPRFNRFTQLPIYNLVL